MVANLILAEQIPKSNAIKQQHFMGLDTVRAFAALSVMLAHILGPKLPDIFRRMGFNGELAELTRYIFTGHPAVIVFFVVSGFCIHFPYTRQRLPIVAFTAARWMRIMVPVVVAILFAKVLHVRNFNFIDGFIVWSIVCELWYYSLYPVFLLLSRKVPFEAQFVVAFLFSLLLVAYLGSDLYGNAHIFGPCLNWLVALPSWLLGCVLAQRISNEAKVKPSCRRSCLYLWRGGVGMVASVLYWLTMNSPIGYYVTMNTFAILVFFWIYAEINSPKNSNLLFERVGRWSFSLYLFHMLFYIFVCKLLVRYFNATIPGMLLINMMAVMWLSFQIHKYVERPSHQYARQLFLKFRYKFPSIAVRYL